MDKKSKRGPGRKILVIVNEPHIAAVMKRRRELGIGESVKVQS